MVDSENSNTETVFKNWLNEYGNDLYSWALHKTSNKTVAEDLLQETFLAAYKSYNSFNGKSSPKTWLNAILNNKITDYYRKNAKTFLNLDSITENKAYTSTEDMFGDDQRWERESFIQWENNMHLLDNKEFVAVLKDCINDLPANWRTAIIAKYVWGKEGAHICKEQNISPSNYWQIIHRAKLLLKKCIELGWFKN